MLFIKMILFTFSGGIGYRLKYFIEISYLPVKCEPDIISSRMPLSAGIEPGMVWFYDPNLSI
jgi:hypothetical protein